MATIEKRGPKTWRVYWRLGGRGGVKQSTTWSDEKRAKRAKSIAEGHKHTITGREVYAAISGVPLQREPEPEKPKAPTVEEWAEVWLATKTRITPGTAAKYRQQLRDHILPALGHMRLDEVEGSHIALLLNEMRGQFKDATVTRYYSCIHALFGYAVRERKIPDNPARRTDWVRDLIAHDDAEDDGADHVYLTQAEFALICSQADPFAEPVLRVLAGTGLRYSEATAIAVSAVSMAAMPDPTVRVYRAWKLDGAGRWYLGTTKGRKRRTIGVNRQLVERFMKPLIGDRAGDALLLRSPRGERLDYANFRYRYWEPALDAAQRCPAHLPEGVEPDSKGRWPTGAVSTCDCPTRLHQRPTLHDLRHSYVAWQIAANVPTVAISRHIGHSTSAITERVYAGILPEVSHAGAVAAGAAMAGVMPDRDASGDARAPVVRPNRKVDQSQDR